MYVTLVQSISSFIFALYGLPSEDICLNVFLSAGTTSILNMNQIFAIERYFHLSSRLCTSKTIALLCFMRLIFSFSHCFMRLVFPFSHGNFQDSVISISLAVKKQFKIRQHSVRPFIRKEDTAHGIKRCPNFHLFFH